jgi:hypothetical protein
MKVVPFLAALLLTINIYAQKHTPLPHGMVYGVKPNTTAMLPASRIESMMGKRVSMSTTIMGLVLKVTQPKGGWFEIDAGKGKIIKAHFKNYAVTLPYDLKGRIVIIEGAAKKQFIADDMQHFAGDTVTGKRQHYVNANPKQRLTFEVKGLMVDK